MARRRKAVAPGLDPPIAEAAIRRAVSALLFDATYSAVLATLAGLQDGAQQALEETGCSNPGSISDTLGRAIGSAITQAFNTVKVVGIPDLPESEVREAARRHVHGVALGAVSGALAVGHSIDAASCTRGRERSERQEASQDHEARSSAKRVKS